MTNQWNHLTVMFWIWYGSENDLFSASQCIRLDGL